jgi:2-phospho-L-lactate guanylyltransferase
LSVDAGLLPVKRLDRAKMRLAPHFERDVRLELARALLEDALDLCEATGFLSWWIVTDDLEAAAAASRRGLDVIPDRGRGLNGALARALAELRERETESVTIVPADVPLAAPEDIADLVDVGATSDVVVVPSTRDGGTNGLFMRPPGRVLPRFGSDSLRAHLHAAATSGLRCSLLEAPRLALDIDTIEDVAAVLATAPVGHTARVLERLGPRARAPAGKRRR